MRTSKTRYKKMISEVRVFLGFKTLRETYKHLDKAYKYFTDHDLHLSGYKDNCWQVMKMSSGDPGVAITSFFTVSLGDIFDHPFDTVRRINLNNYHQNNY